MQTSFLNAAASPRSNALDRESATRPKPNAFAGESNVASPAANRPVATSSASSPANPAISADADNAPAVRLLTETLQEATRRNASDLHIEPAEHGWRVRLRIDGVLHEIPQPPAHLRDAFITRVKVLARMDIAERRVPQDGRLRIAASPGRVEDYRVNSLPTLFGEKLVLRRLDALPADLSLDTLGLDPRQRETLDAAIRAPHGLVLVTGPTGSGKTLSLYCFLNLLNAEATQSVFGRRSSGNPASRHQSGQCARKGRADFRGSAARVFAAGPRRDHGRRNPRRTKPPTSP